MMEEEYAQRSILIFDDFIKTHNRHIYRSGLIPISLEDEQGIVRSITTKYIKIKHLRVLFYALFQRLCGNK